MEDLKEGYHFRMHHWTWTICFCNRFEEAWFLCSFVYQVAYSNIPQYCVDVGNFSVIHKLDIAQESQFGPTLCLDGLVNPSFLRFLSNDLLVSRKSFLYFQVAYLTFFFLFFLSFFWLNITQLWCTRAGDKFREESRATSCSFGI